MTRDEIKTKLNPREVEGRPGRMIVSGLAIAVQVVVLVWMVTMLIGCTSSVRVVDQPSAYQEAVADTAVVQSLGPLRPGSRVTHALSVTQSLEPIEIDRYPLRFVGLEITRDRVTVRTASRAGVQDHTYRNVRAAGEVQTIVSDTAGVITATIEGAPIPDTVQIMAIAERPKKRIWDRWWFGPVALLVAGAVVVYLLRGRAL